MVNFTEPAETGATVRTPRLLTDSDDQPTALIKNPVITASIKSEKEKKSPMKHFINKHHGSRSTPHTPDTKARTDNPFGFFIKGITNEKKLNS